MKRIGWLKRINLKLIIENCDRFNKKFAADGNNIKKSNQLVKTDIIIIDQNFFTRILKGNAIIVRFKKKNNSISIHISA